MGLLNPKHVLLLLIGLLPISARGGAVITGTLGADSRDHFKGALFAYNVGLFAKFDDQTLIGFQSGQGTLTGSQSIPVLGSAMIRLPIGRVVLPVATGDIGYAIDKRNSGFLWRAGGGFDIRNGRSSSFLLLGNYERQGSRFGWSGRLGILLEF